jgi:hypothetical protein
MIISGGNWRDKIRRGALNNSIVMTINEDDVEIPLREIQKHFQVAGILEYDFIDIGDIIGVFVSEFKDYESSNYIEPCLVIDKSVDSLKVRSASKLFRCNKHEEFEVSYDKVYVYVNNSWDEAINYTVKKFVESEPYTRKEINNNSGDVEKLKTLYESRFGVAYK